MNWLSYLLQINLLLLVFYGFYRVLLSKETYNVNNRFFLVLSGVLALLLPFWNSDLVQSWGVTQQLSEWVPETHEGGNHSNPAKDQYMGLPALLLFFYVSGFTFFLLKFGLDLFKALSPGAQHQQGPFSFFGRISVDEELDKNEIITEHELVHARQGHSFDIIFFEILGIVCWFNPVIWLYKKSLRNIHEFIADEVASYYMSSKAEYAMLLLSQQFRVSPIPLVSTFVNYTNLKIRIQMLKKERSGRAALVRYVLVLPLLTASLVMTSALILNKKNAEKLAAAVPLLTLAEELALLDKKDQDNEEKSVEVELQTVTSWQAYSIFSKVPE